MYCQTLKEFFSMVKLTLEEITIFSWKLKLSQLNYFTENFGHYLESLRTFTRK